MRTRGPVPVLSLVLLSGAALAGCSSGGDSGGASPADTASGGATAPIAVSSTDTACTLSAIEAASGVVTFSVTNEGSQVTEFYLYGSDGTRILGEVENIGPGITRDLVITAEPGSYVTACKPGMAGEGIRADFTVTGAAVTSPSASRRSDAEAAGRFRGSHNSALSWPGG